MKDVPAWIVEFYKRFSLKSPKFFQVLQTIGWVAAVLSGIPFFLIQFDITLPPALDAIASKTVAIAGVVLWVVSKLPVDRQETILRTTDAMPFTQMTNDKKVKLPYNYDNV